MIVTEQKHGGRGVPRRVAAGFERRTDAAGREGGGVRLTLDEHFSGKLAEDLTVRRGGKEGVVLFGGQPGHGLEPVRVVGGPVFEGPVLHRPGDDVGVGGIERSAPRHGLHEPVVHVAGKTLAHDARVEHVAAIPGGKGLARLGGVKRRNRLGNGKSVKSRFTDSGGTHGFTPRKG